MSWTSPRTWIAHELVTDTMLNAHIRDNFNMVTRGIHQLVDAAGIGNSGASQTQVYARSEAGGLLTTDGDTLVVEAHGLYSANGANKRAFLALNSNTIADTGTVATNNGLWHLRAVIRRVSATVSMINALVSQTSGGVNPQQSAPAITWASSITIEVYLDGDATNDLRLLSVFVELKRSGA